MARVRPNGGVLGPPITVSGTSASGMFSIVEANLDKQAGNFPVYTPVASTDPQFNLTTLLLHGDGSNAANNNTFLDSSTNAFTLTSTGTPTQGSFSPYSQTGWSNYFGGSEYVICPANVLNTIGTGNCTIEAWIYVTTTGVQQGIVSSHQTGGMTYLILDSTNHIAWAVNISGGAGTGYQTTTSSTTINLNTWTHVAVVRNGTELSIWINGNRDSNVGTLSGGTDIGSYGGAKPFYIGASPDAGSKFNGYISNVRFVNGTAVYTSTFTPSTTPLTAITNTRILTCQSNRFVDNGPNGTITLSGSPQIQPFSPFAPAAAYGVSSVGGSMFFNTTSDYLYYTDTINGFGTGDFTIEFWVYSSSASQNILFNSTTSNNWAVIFYLQSVYWQYNGSNILNTSSSVQLNAWNHVALARSSSTLTIYINGVSGASATVSTSIPTPTGSKYIGPGSGGTGTYYLSNVRIVKGTAVYTSAFTPPTAPVTAITNTSLLVNGTNAAIYDSTAKNDLVTVGSAQISTAQAKFGGSSMNFGSGSYLTSPTSSLYAFGTGDFTIETFIYLTSVPSDTCIIDGRDGTGTVVKPCLFVQQSSSNFIFYVNGAVRVQGGTYSLNTWQHVAVSRSGGSTKLFVNGTQVGSTYTDSNSYLACSMRIAYFNDGSTTNSFNGYIDELRITKYARYTSTFTPTTSSFLNQ